MAAEAKYGRCDWTMTTFAVSLQAENRAEFAERTVAKLEKTIDDLEGTVVKSLFFLIRTLNQSFQFWIFSLCPVFSLLICTSLRFSCSLFLCSPTCRWTVQSEAEIQGYQRGAGSCPQWSEQLVKLSSDPRISSFTVAHLIWSTLFLLSSLLCPKCTIKLLASTLSPFYFFLLLAVSLFIKKHLKKGRHSLKTGLYCFFNSAATLSCRWTERYNAEKCRLAPGPGPNNAGAQ